VLKQLNQAETVHEGQAAEQALELAEIERRLSDFWAIEKGAIKVPLALGLLLRNGLIRIQDDGAYSWQRQRDVASRYCLTSEGKKFLVSAMESNDRIA